MIRPGGPFNTARPEGERQGEFQRIAAHDHPDFHWHTNFVASEYWHFQKTEGLLWYDALLEIYAPDDVYTHHNWLVQKEKGMPPWLARAKGIPIPWKEQRLLDMLAR